MQECTNPIVGDLVQLTRPLASRNGGGSLPTGVRGFVCGHTGPYIRVDFGNQIGIKVVPVGAVTVLEEQARPDVSSVLIDLVVRLSDEVGRLEHGLAAEREAYRALQASFDELVAASYQLAPPRLVVDVERVTLSRPASDTLAAELECSGFSFWGHNDEDGSQIWGRLRTGRNGKH